MRKAHNRHARLQPGSSDSVRQAEDRRSDTITDARCHPKVGSSGTEPPPQRRVGAARSGPASRPGPAPRPRPDPAPEPHFSTSADFMMWVLDAVSFQGPKEKSWWLLWKPWIIMAEAGPAWAGRHRLERERRRRRQRTPVSPASLRPSPSASEPLPCPAPPSPAANPDARPPFRLLLRPFDFCFRDQLPVLRDPRLTSRRPGKKNTGEKSRGGA